jgi:hypothetical protein
MIQFEKTYDINDGNGSVTFKKVDDLTVEAVYNRGTIKGTLDGEKLKGQFIDNVSNGQGLIEFTFNENGFEAKWKSGLEEGPLKGKWVGIIDQKKSSIIFNNDLTEEQTAFIREKSWWNREEVPNEWFSSPAFITEIVKNDKDWFQLASNEIRKDKEIVKKIIQEQPRAIEFVDESLLNNLDIAKLSIREIASMLKFFKDPVNNDYDIVLEAVQKDGWCLEYASENLKNNFEIVSKAVADTGYALQFASEDLKKNKGIVLTAVSQDGNALEFAHDSLKSDKEIVKKAFSEKINAISFIEDNLKENEEFIIELIQLTDQEKYKELFLLLPSKIRASKSVSDLISKQYKNAKRWSDTSLDESFLNYLEYFDSQQPWENEDNLSEFEDEYGINLTSNYFQHLDEEFKIVKFIVDNSDYAWGELGGNEKFTIIYDRMKNRILPKNMESPDEDNLSLIKKYQYLDSMHIGIYGPYHEVQAFNGCYSVCNYFDENRKLENNFIIYFHGDEIEEYSEGNPDVFQKLKEAITPKEMYKFLSEVISKF